MRRVMAVVLAAGVAGLCGPAWGQSRGGHVGSRAGIGGGHPSGGGFPGVRSFTGTAGRSTTVVRGQRLTHPPGLTGHPIGGDHGWHRSPGWHHTPGWGGRSRWGGTYGWGPSFWWGGSFGFGWPYGYWGYWGPSWSWWPGIYGPGYYGPGDWPYGSRDLMAVDTDVSPEKALVALNGVVIGTADDFDGYPDYLYLEPGHYTIEFRMPGYLSQTAEIDAQPGQKMRFDSRLQPDRSGAPAAAYERPQGLPYGRVFGPDLGKAPERSAAGPDLSLRPEFQHRAVAAPPSQPPPPPPAGSIAALRLDVSPPEAVVYLDGSFLGLARDLARMQRGVAVSPGAHSVEVMAPGHAPKRVEVAVEAGTQAQVTVALQ